jgi:hypothetical protein
MARSLGVEPLPDCSLLGRCEESYGPVNWVSGCTYGKRDRFAHKVTEYSFRALLKYRYVRVRIARYSKFRSTSTSNPGIAKHSNEAQPDEEDQKDVAEAEDEVEIEVEGEDEIALDTTEEDTIALTTAVDLACHVSLVIT